MYVLRSFKCNKVHGTIAQIDFPSSPPILIKLFFMTQVKAVVVSCLYMI